MTVNNEQAEHTPVRTKPWVPTFLSSEEFSEVEKQYVMKVIDNKHVFRYSGKKDSEAAQLEKLYRDRLNIKHCLAVNAGTSALISALIGAGIGPGDEVIVPAYTYIASASAVLIARAVPVIVECDDSLTLDPNAIEAAITPYTKAILPVHMKGIPCQMDEIMAIARKHNLIVIEDVAQANGGSYKGKQLGSIGDAGCFSFQQYKLITSGEGGMVATNNDTIYARACVYHDSAYGFWGINEFENVTLFPGENYRMSEINAALGLAQSERIDTVVAKLRNNKSKIVAGIKDIPQIQLQRVPDPEGDVSYSLNFFLKDAETAEKFASLLVREGIPCGTINNNGFADRHIYKNWTYIMEKRGASEQDTPWNCQSYKGNVQYSVDMCPNTLDWLSRAISISLHQSMSEEDCQDAINAIQKAASFLD
ncbi:DegT/DnrJ/EryC1/StrS family aminotransferase [Paenibacillus eucommiae]|uniref:8-amino-3,8-dideoxy-alpha-D-manno-octulosonate transaminase n=1 Tax=Paenibacillus eucommiae TaxID=1355755 RepID=A0ABS4J663_9BACL|nr:DegT/DnrJ/EryC1/StrS family aminotransferase [Paenibacillus eucommiae]MBP1994616.1 8-amino-3,8-dideoxy-alpha-D-manno-octulosonate transaminase [Paenibacillus eucommiae]